MDRFHILEKLGDGTYGTVMKAKNKETGEALALKRLKRPFHSWKECVTLREVESLRSISEHPQVVKLREVIRESNSCVFFVFEYMSDGNLYEYMKKCARESQSSGSTSKKYFQRGVIEINKVRSILSQVLTGLAHIHSRGYFHRDIKPENILLRGNQCKIADFGLAREIRSLPPYTEYVSTRWYRAPEVLLRSPKYGPPIDVFAVGCVAAELITLQPLLPGTSELDQVRKIFDLLGEPSPQNWPEGLQLAAKMNIRLESITTSGLITGALNGPQYCQDGQMKLKAILPLSSPDMVFFLWSMLRLDPRYRPSAGQSLCFSFFDTLGSGGSIDAKICSIQGNMQPSRPVHESIAGVKRSRMEDEIRYVCPSRAHTQFGLMEDTAFNMQFQHGGRIQNHPAFGVPQFPIDSVSGTTYRQPQPISSIIDVCVNPSSVLGTIEGDEDSSTPRLMAEQNLTPGVSPLEFQIGKNMSNSSAFSSYRSRANKTDPLHHQPEGLPPSKKYQKQESGNKSESAPGNDLFHAQKIFTQHNHPHTIHFSHLRQQEIFSSSLSPRIATTLENALGGYHPPGDQSVNVPLNTQQGGTETSKFLSALGNTGAQMNAGVDTSLRPIVGSAQKAMHFPKAPDFASTHFLNLPNSSL